MSVAAPATRTYPCLCALATGIVPPHAGRAPCPLKRDWDCVACEDSGASKRGGECSCRAGYRLHRERARANGIHPNADVFGDHDDREPGDTEWSLGDDDGREPDNQRSYL